VIQLSAVMVRSMKGAAASILLLFMAEQRALSQGEMRRYTAYGDEAINDALLLLRDQGLVVQTGRYSWALLADGTRQLPIGAEDSPVESPVDNSVDKIEESAEYENLAPVEPELDSHACMQDSLTPESIDDDPACMGRSDLTGAEELAAELARAGFREPGLSRMRKQPGLTARIVRYHVEKTGGQLGLAMYRIEHRFRVPDDFERGSPDDRRKYAGGKYADFVVT